MHASARWEGPITDDQNAALLVIDAVWHGEVRRDARRDLRGALALASRNNVAGRLALAYAGALREDARRAADAQAAFGANIRSVFDRLTSAGVEGVLIKTDPAMGAEYSNFDVVVGDDGWDRAVEALRTWGRSTSTHPLERRKLLVHPDRGPSAHLHRDVSWFDIRIIEASSLRARAASSSDGVLLPDRADALRITLAHAIFQNLALDLEELMLIRPLVHDEQLVADAAARAAAEGWGRSFILAHSFARRVVAGLDDRRVTRLPAIIPAALAWRAGAEHAQGAWRGGRRVEALRELALRPALVAAKRRRNR